MDILAKIANEQIPLGFWPELYKGAEIRYTLIEQLVTVRVSLPINGIRTKANIKLAT